MPHPVDIELGKKLRHIRKSRGMSQTQLAQQVGITFQQIQKYERGQNRISVSRLFEIAKVLQVPMSCFWPDGDEESRNHEMIEQLEKLKLLNGNLIEDAWSRFENSSANLTQSLLKLAYLSPGESLNLKEVLANFYAMHQNLELVLDLMKEVRTLVGKKDADLAS